jgi:hypothetical protein
MYIARRASIIAFFAGLVFIGIGSYDIFIETGSQQKPTAVSIESLASSIPQNRHLIVTGGKALLDKALVVYKLKHGVRVPNSEVYYVPIAHSSAGRGESSPPRLILKMNELQMQHALSDGLDTSNVEGVRVPQLELDSEAEKLLDNYFGPEMVRQLVVLDYHRQMNGIWFGIAAMALGAFLSSASVLGYWFLQNASGRPVSAEPLHLSVFSTTESGGRKRRIGTIVFWIALIIAAPIIAVGILIAIKGLVLLSGK